MIARGLGREFGGLRGPLQRGFRPVCLQRRPVSGGRVPGGTVYAGGGLGGTLRGGVVAGGGRFW